MYNLRVDKIGLEANYPMMCEFEPVFVLVYPEQI